MPDDRPKLYHELAAWWPLMSPPADYAPEAALLLRLSTDACDGPPRTLLELGSGGGHTASHLKGSLRITLVDVSPEMLAVSRSLNPNCEHIEGDMRTVRLGRTFDAVFVHDAVMHLTTEADLSAAIATAFEHCRPGGAAIFAPDWVRETFFSSTDHGGTDGHGRALRYLEWTFDPDPNDTWVAVEFVYLMREAAHPVRIEHDKWRLGLFSRTDWLRLLTCAGFVPRTVSAAFGAEWFVAVRPA
jgi:SAM-dependent methyltransferase